MSDLFRRMDINYRKIRTYSYYVLGMLIKKKKIHRVIKNIVYFPSVSNIIILKDLVNRISWYYPSSEFAGIGQLEAKVCEFLHVTPRQLGDIRRQDPLGVAFIEQHIIWVAEEKQKAYKEAERKSKHRRKR